MGAAFEGVEGYVFVGLNALNECEKKVMRRMRDAGLAEFCWDYSGAMVKNPLTSLRSSCRGMSRTSRRLSSWIPMD